jgi:hypothetical protein
MVVATLKQIPDTAAFMETQNYLVRGGSLVHTIFVDSNKLIT